MKTVFETLEFEKIQKQVEKYALTEIGREYVFNMRPYNDSIKLNKELTILNEMMSLILRYGTLPIQNSIDLIKKISLAKKGGVLSINDLEQVANDILSSLKIKKFFMQYKDQYLKLNNEIDKLVDLKFLEERIHRVISPSLTIYDNASNKLSSIRSSMRRIEQEVKRKIMTLLNAYEPLLSDKTVTMRNGHFVLPVKTGDKNKVSGIIHDISDTGQTTFIEPSEVVELNNRLYLLSQDEKEEIMHILKELTIAVIEKEESVIANNRRIGYLDFISAKALYGNENAASVGEISSTYTLDIRNARHPLLDKNTCVPNDFYLDERKHILLISGPNAGGKSVALKTVGLAVIMHLCGLPILCDEGAKIPLFKRIYVDIGDQQSLSDSLSTFSAHLENLVIMTNHLGNKDLVIFDELGTGTDPLEGEALAKAAIDFFHSRHALALITSHFNGVKSYGIECPYVASGSMLFDESTMTPTYHLHLGLPGKSYGLQVAKRLGLNDDIVDRANSYFNQSANESSGVLNNLHHIVQENDKVKKELAKEKEKLKIKEKELRDLENQLKRQKSTLLEDAINEKNEIIEEAKNQVEQIMKSLNKDNLKLHEAIAAKKLLEDEEDNSDEEESVELDNVSIGDFVHISSLDYDGRVLKINKNRVLVSTNRGKLEVDISDLSKTIETNKKNPTSQYSYQVDDVVLQKRVPLELNIIGLHVDEALNKLEEYIDSVIVKNYKQVRIIHGSGTGVLRKVVHEYLTKIKEVDSFRLGGLNEGGVGATVVYFK